MTILLLTDIPPTKTLTAGLVLDQLCRLLPQGSIACYTVLNPHLTARLTPDLGGIPVKYVPKPNEYGLRWPESKGGAFLSYAAQTYRRRYARNDLVEDAAEFARAVGADRIWAVLQGQTIISMALPLADRLGIPLYTQVWDPLSWWLKAHEVDRFSRARAHADFDRALLSSRACATASWAMSEVYGERYGTRCVPLIASHPAELGLSPDLDGCRDDCVTIGMAGQFYAAEEWHTLVRALTIANWRVGGKEVRLRVLGAQPPPPGTPPEKVDFRGWVSQPEAVRLLAETDVLFCPYSFVPDMREVSETSFPSKVPLYLASGKPILFHGPKYSSPYRYLARHGAAALSGDPEATSVYNALHRLVADKDFYRRVGENGQKAFREDFTLDSMRRHLLDFLELDPATPLPGADAHAPGPATTVQAIDRMPTPVDGEFRFPDGVPSGAAILWPEIQGKAVRQKMAAASVALLWPVRVTKAIANRMAAILRSKKSVLRRVALLLPPIRSLYQWGHEEKAGRIKAESNASSLQSERDALLSDFESVSRERAELSERLEKMRDQLASIKEERDASAARLNTVTLQLSRAQSERDEFAVRLDELRRTVEVHLDGGGNGAGLAHADGNLRQDKQRPTDGRVGGRRR